MKYFHNKAFPHPVLSTSNDDYEGVCFQSNIEWRASKEEIAVDISFTLSDENIINLIKKKEAEFIIEIECKKTYTRKIYRTFGKEVTEKNGIYQCSDKFNFKKGDLDGSVTTNCYIISKEDNNEFNSKNFHKDYEDNKFHIREGDVLALREPFSHYFDRELTKSIGTFFKICANEQIADGQFSIDYGKESYIGIMTNRKTKESIDLTRSQREKKHLLLGSLYFPAILEILHEMQKNVDEHQDKSWFVGIGKVLKQQTPSIKIENKNSDFDLLKATQQILKNPFITTIKDN